MRVLISFIGKGRKKPDGAPQSPTGYERTLYDFQDGSPPEASSLFGAALLRWLNAHGKHVDTWLVMGTAQSIWSEVMESAEQEPPLDDWARVQTLVDQGRMDQATLDAWQATLQPYLGQTRLVLRLTGALDTMQSQECAWKALDELVPDGSSVVLDITHGFRHQPVVVAFMVTLLRWLRHVKEVDLYYGALDMRRNGGAAPVLQLPVCNTLLRAAEGVATLAYTGDFVPLARTLSLEEETRQKLERIAFLEETYREPRGEGRQVLAKLRQASLTPVDQSLERLMAERLGWVTRERLTDRLRQRAQFAFDRRQYLRAFVLVYEAVVVAAVMRYGPDGDPRSREVRMAARDRLYADASRDPELVRRFKYIQAIRNAIVHGTRTDDGSVKKALHSPEELKAAFNDAIKLVDDLAGQRSGSNEAPSRAAGL